MPDMADSTAIITMPASALWLGASRMADKMYTAPPAMPARTGIIYTTTHSDTPISNKRWLLKCIIAQVMISNAANDAGIITIQRNTLIVICFVITCCINKYFRGLSFFKIQYCTLVLQLTIHLPPASLLSTTI